MRNSAGGLMEISTVNDCFKKRLLRETRPDKEKTKKSIEMSGKMLERARLAIEKDMYETAIIWTYDSMFHAGRALLFKDGIIEKSHICLVLYLQKYYAELNKIEQRFINILNNMRIKRNDQFYGLDEIKTSIQDADIAVKQAEEFLNKVKEILS